MSKKTSLLLAVVIASMLFACQSLAAGLEKYQFLKTAAQEQKAVMKTPEGSLQLVGVGDVIAGNSKVVEIAEERIVLEEQTSEDIETVIIRLDGLHQRIERLRKRGEKPSALIAPGTR